MKLKGQQTAFFTPEFNQSKFDEFEAVVSKIYSLLRHKTKDSIALSNIVEKGEPLRQNMNEDILGKPEHFTRSIIIDPILDYLGYIQENRGGETELKSIFGRKDNRYPDYKLLASQNLHFLVEAEALNEDLYSTPNKGLNQVYDWLDRKRTKTDYGMATDGFEWVLVQYLVEANKKIQIKKINLKPFFLKLLGKDVQDSLLKEIFLEFFSYFSRENADSAINGFVIMQNERREDISKKFYEKYLMMIFGVNKKGDKIYNHSLFDAIQNVENVEQKKKIAQLTVNRLVFIKFIESKGWINGNSNFLKDLKSQYLKNPTPAGFFKTYLEPLFFLALNNPSSNKPPPYENVRYLNGGLFRKDKTEEVNSSYNISNDELLRVIDFLEEYAFKIKGSITHSSNEILDPEILGYIFERTANHEAGAYYTPEYITTQIANQTIDSLLLERVNSYLKEKGEKERTEIYSIFGDGGLDIDHLRNLYEKRQILYISILDPACGSGAFFMPAIRKLVDYHRRFYKEIYRSEPNVYQIQKKVVEENIYGVDINEEAIEIAKLRLWLDLLDTVEDISLVDSLPNIEYNIMSGNSLIGAIEIPETSRVQFYTYYHPARFEQILQVYPELIKEAERLAGKDASFETSFKDLFLLRNKLISKYRIEVHPVYSTRLRSLIENISDKFRSDLSKSFFHKMMGIETNSELIELNGMLKPFNWVMEFSDVFDKGGFDVVIGNPPYVRPHKIDAETKRFLWKHSKVVKAKGDLYAAFIERGLMLLRPGGMISYIVPHTWLSLESFEDLRKYSLENSQIKSLVILPRKVFKEAEVETLIFVFEKNSSSEHDSNNLIEFGEMGVNGNITILGKKHQYEFYNNIFDISTGENARLVSKIEDNSEKLFDLADFFYGIKTADDAQFLTFKPINEVDYKRLLRRSDFYRYGIRFRGEYVLYKPELMIKNKRTARPGEPKRFEENKIIIMDIAKKLVCTYDDEGYYIKDALILKQKVRGLDLRYLVALINSKLLNYYYKQKYKVLSVAKNAFLDLPIKIVPKYQEQLCHMVDHMIRLNKQLSQLVETETSERKRIIDELNILDESIDDIVFQIYNITSEAEKKHIKDSLNRAGASPDAPPD